MLFVKNSLQNLLVRRALAGYNPQEQHPDQSPRRCSWLLAMIASSLLAALGLLLMLQSGALATDDHENTTEYSPATTLLTDTPSACAGVTTVPVLECQALADLFSQTDGTNWLTKTGWLNFGTPNAPCDWYGVTCHNNQVRELNLARNQLNGALPGSLKQFTALTRLRLEKNALRGNIPRAVCQLTTTLQEADFGYNSLASVHRTIRQCMAQIDPDWLTTQTSPVTRLRPTEFFTNALRLSWTPISYTVDGGYYQIAAATAISGPYRVLTRTSDKLVDGFLVTGLKPAQTYFFRVRTQTPEHDDQPNALLSNPAETFGVTTAQSGRVLIAAYFAADNNLAANIAALVHRFRVGTALNRNVHVLLLVDGRKFGDTQVLNIYAGQVTETAAVSQRWGTTELDTGDPAVLTWFLRYARAQVAAERTIVTLMGHGLALAPEITWPNTLVNIADTEHYQGEIPPLPKEHDLTPSDLTNRGYMSTVDMGQALMAATNNGADPFDVVYFDQCFQGNLDTLYEVHKTGRVFIASPNYAWLAAAYLRYISEITPTATPEEIAQSIITLYENVLEPNKPNDPNHPNAIFWVRGADIPIIAEAVSQMGDALRRALQAEATQPLIDATKGSQYVDTTQCGRGQLDLRPPDELIGATTFAKLLAENYGENDPHGVHSAASALQTQLKQLVHRDFLTGTPYIDPSVTWSYSDTLTILAPLPPDSPGRVAWRASLYRSDTPFSATWTVDPSQLVTVTASPAFVHEGRWDEFLAAWFNDLKPTVGQWCNYIPSPKVPVAESEAISLTLTSSGTTQIQLNWTATDDDRAIEYVLQGKEPYDIGWLDKEVLPTISTSISVSDLVSGTYRFNVAARTEEGVLVAQSNEVETTVMIPVQRPLYLPLIQR